MLPISIAGSISIGCPPGLVVARLDVAYVGFLEIEVAPGLDADQVRVGLVRAGEVARALDRRVLDHRHVGADRADEARGPELLGDLLDVGWAEIGSERVAELDLVEAVVAAHAA